MLPEHQIILRLVVAAVLGSVVGVERERLNWVAGLRTHMCSDLITSERRLDYSADFDWDYMRIGARSCCHYLRID